MSDLERRYFFEKFEEGDLLTRPNGEINILQEDYRNIAIFRSGVVAVNKSARWSSRTKMLMDLAKRIGFEVNQVVEMETADIVAIYDREKISHEEDESEADEAIERQEVLRDIIQKAASQGASDIHIRVLRKYAEIRIRVFGRMTEVGSLTPDEGMAIISAAFAVASDTGNSASMMSFQQGALQKKSGLLPPGIDMLRLQYSPTSEQRGALVARLKHATPSNETDIEPLGYSGEQLENIKTMRRRTNGLYILSGKVSSGKTTTLQRTLNKMFTEKNQEISMYTIEEPVELDLFGAVQVPVKKMPDGTDGFVEAMKASLRSDCNVIVMGEIRSKETADLAIQAVMTGHALWSTVHAGFALGILDRLTDLGVEKWKLEDPGLIRGLVYQRLCGVICSNCRITMAEAAKKSRVEEKIVSQVEELFQMDRKDLYARGDGCEKCKLGLSGRTVVAETIMTDPHLLDLYGQGKRREMFDYWTKPVSEGGLEGRPVMHHALAKVGAGLLDINEVEEEVDLLDSYTTFYPHLFERLRADIKGLRPDTI